MAIDNNDFTHEFQIYSTDKNAGTMGTGKFLLFDDNINAVKVESIDNIKIGGGSNGRVLATDGEGNLYWMSAAAVTGGVSNYNDLNDLPDLSVYSQTADLATVATSGSYSDLSNKPSLFSGSYTDLTNKPTLVTSYNQLTDKPTIPTVPTDISAFTNDAGYLTSVTNITGNAATVSNGVYTSGNYANPAWITSLAYSKLTDAPSLATVATSGDYADLTNKPSIFSGSYSDLTNRPTIFSGDYADLANKPVLFDGAYLSLTGAPNLAAVATSGSYDDLSNKPSIPDLTGYATESWVTSQGYGSGSGGQTFDQNLNTTNSVMFNNLALTGSIDLINGAEISSNNAGSIDLFTDWGNGGVEVWLQHGDRVAIRTADGNYAWNFDANGKLTLPELGQGLGWTNTDSAPTPDTEFLYSSTISFDKNQGVVLNHNVGGNNINWTFETDGDLTAPGNVTIAGRFVNTEDGYLNLRGSTAGPTSRIHLRNYNDDPTSDVNVHLQTGNGSQTFEIFQLGASHATYPFSGGLRSNSASAPIIVQTDTDNANNTWVFGLDGILTLPAGGDIKDSTGNSVLGGGGGNANTGNVVFDGNSLYVGGTGFLNLETDNGEAAIGTNGPDSLLVSINEGDKVWTFDTNGDLTLPAGGDIKNSSGNSVLGGSGGTSGFTKAVVAGQNDILANESGNTLELVAGDGIAITTNDSDGTITISAASNTTPQYGYFSELVETSSSNRVNTQAVVMDSDGNSYISYVYWDDNQSKDISGMAKYDSTGEQLWTVNLASQNPDARELNIRSLEFATFDGDPALIAVGYYYDNNTNKDVAFMFYVNPVSGSVGEPLIDCELVAQSGMNVKDGVAGYDGSNPYAVIVGETYDQTLVKTLTPLSGSTTDKLFVSWADFAASGVNTGEGVYYVDGPNQYGVTMNAIGVSATVAGSTDPAWAGISITVSKNEAGNYIVSSVNGWGYLVNSWSNPVTLTVLGSALGGVDSVNDMTFDFSNVVFDNNSSNIQAAISNIQGTPVAGVYCPGWGGFDWNTQVGNALNFNYQLNNQAYVARFGQTAAWTKNFGGGSYDRLNSVVVDNSGNVYAVGYVWNGSRGGLVIKYDIDGNQQWAVYINPANNTGNALMSVDLLSDGNVITVDEDGVITKLDSGNGDIMWQVKADTDPSWDGDFRGTATPDGDYIITNYEDNDYTQYVMRVSGVDGTSVWDKRISRTYGGDNGEVTSNDDGQYIDCNATHLTIAGRTEPPSGNSVGLVYSFPINGENTDGTYGQYVITSESMNWETLSTTSIAATITNTDISVTVNSVSPTSGSSLVNVSTTTAMGGAPVVEPTVISWTNPNDNVWRIEDYNGGASVSYDGDDYDAKWFNIDNHSSGSSNFRGAIIQYHAFIQNQGTMIGTIHLATDYSQEGATHTEHLSGNSDLQFVTLWDCNNNDGELYFKMTNGNSANLFIQWTAKVFYGQEYND